MMIQPLLLQRLELYRFAYVMVDPAQLPSPRDWQLPRLVASIPDDPQLALRLNLPTPVRGARGPILSTSVRRLQHFRRHEPYRPLILIRPAFERTLPAKRLAGLAVVAPLLKRLFTPEDAISPLEWRRPLSVSASSHNTWQPEMTPHPLIKHLQNLRKHRPQSEFYVQEDGLVLEQQNLLDASPYEPINSEGPALGDYDRHWLSQFGTFKGHWYVMSRSHKVLTWFARDSLRLLGPHTYRWFFPEVPDLRNLGLNWILVHDRELRWRCLQRDIPVLHLDDDEVNRCYRALRLSHGGRVRWRTREPLRAKGILKIANRAVLCQDKGSGWQLAFSEQAAPDQSKLLNHRLDQLASLST